MKHLILIIFFVLVTQEVVYSRTADEIAAKTAFIVKMTSFISWPDDSIKQDRSFYICTDGKPVDFSELHSWAKSGSIKSMPVTIRYVSIESSDLASCNILYIRNNDNIDGFLERTREVNALTVSDRPGNASLGVIINFVRSGDSLRFEINLEAAESNGFAISPKLLRLADIVETGADKQ